MNQEIKAIVDRIESSVGDGFPDIAEEQLDLHAEIDVDGESLEALLRLFEDHPEADFGMPGPIVHFLERFYKRGYEPELLKSIERTPVPHTLWMLNRIINGSDGATKAMYLTELQQVLNRPDVEQQTRQTAKEFLDLHQ